MPFLLMSSLFLGLPAMIWQSTPQLGYLRDKIDVKHAIATIVVDVHFILSCSDDEALLSFSTNIYVDVMQIEFSKLVHLRG